MMQQVDITLPEKLKRAIIDRLYHELTALRLRQIGSGYNITINIDPDTSEFDMQLSTTIAKVKVK